MPRRYEDDDGRTVANMDIEGMPYPRKDPNPLGSVRPSDPMSRRDQLRVAVSATLAGVCVALGLIAIFALFILFCTHVWFR